MATHTEVVEGHSRATAFAVVRGNRRIDVVLGIAPLGELRNLAVYPPG
jgi:hypothetical protein